MPSILHDQVELRHLRYFRALAEARSFTRAAAAIGLKQPTLSHQIRQLEDALGAELFQRGRTDCALTPPGELLLPYVQRVLGEMDGLRQALDDLSGLRRGSLSIAVLPVVAERMLGRALVAFQGVYPGIQVKVTETTVDEMVRILAAGTVDLCIGPLDTFSSSMNHQSLYEEELVAVFKPSRFPPSRRTITVAELAKHPLVVAPAGFGTRTLLLRAFGRARRTPNFAMEATSTEVVLESVESGGGVGVLPASALWGRIRSGWTAIRITQPVLRRRIGLFQTRVARRRPASEAFLPMLTRAIQTCAREAGEPDGATVLRCG